MPQRNIESLPNDVKQALPAGLDVSGGAYAAIGTAPGTSLGETHLLALPSRLFVFCRASYGAPLEPFAIEPARPPSIEVEQFANWLVFHLDDGRSERILLTPFDIESVEWVLTVYHKARTIQAPTVTLSPTTTPTGAPAIAIAPGPAVTASPSQDATPARAAASEGGLRGLLSSARGVTQKASAMAGEQVGKNIDRALDMIEFAARRASTRQMEGLRVSVRLNLGLGDVTIEGAFDAETLRSIAAREEGGASGE